MSQTYQAPAPTPTPPPTVTPAPAPPARHVATTTYEPTVERTGWTGWVVFGGVMMIALGIFQAIEGLTALFRETYFLVPQSNLLVNVDYTAWGWTHLGIGVVALLAGLGLLAGQMWARVVGVVVAMASAVVNLAFVMANPVWAVTMIVVDLIVIYAIIVHGRELKT